VDFAVTNIPFDEISVGVFGKLDANGNAFKLLPDNAKVDSTPYVTGNDHYTFTDPPGPVNLTSLTVVSNAVQVGGMNDWAAVKTNDWVYVQATLSYMSDAKAADQIQWSTGDKVAYDPFQRKVSKAVSAKIPVTATLGSISKTVNVWILWATVNIQTSDNNPSPLMFPTNFPGNELGPRYYYWSGSGLATPTNETSANCVMGKMCGVASITPAGVHTIITNEWKFVQMYMPHPFANGGRHADYSDNWRGDPFNSNYESLIPDDNDKIYYVDGPAVTAYYATDSFEQNCNFYSSVTWRSETCSDTNNYWHFRGKWKVDRTPQISDADVGPGTMNLPTNSTYSAP
jgi:hypothetical protein